MLKYQYTINPGIPPEILDDGLAPTVSAFQLPTKCMTRNKRKECSSSTSDLPHFYGKTTWCWSSSMTQKPESSSSTQTKGSQKPEPSSSTQTKGSQKPEHRPSTHTKGSQHKPSTQIRGSQHRPSTQTRGSQHRSSTQTKGSQHRSSTRRKGSHPNSQRAGSRKPGLSSMSNLATSVSTASTRNTKKTSFRNQKDLQAANHQTIR